MNPTKSKISPYRPVHPRQPYTNAEAQPENIALITQHIQQHVGPPDLVFAEIVSDQVHIDVHIVAPSAARPFYTLVTSGMSDKKSLAPAEYPSLGYSELFLCLPPDWNMDQRSWNDRNNSWPIRWLKHLALYPHKYQQWLWFSHSVNNHESLDPIANNTEFCAFLLYDPVLLPEEFGSLEVDEEKTIHFFSILPLFKQELEYKLAHGAGALIHAYVEAGHTELVDLARKPCVG